jgi:uncharacterized NAD(P)/FAD-binding protein YdhS
VLLRLRELGHRGTITAISRHGAFPTRHAAYEPLQKCVIAGKPPTKARLLLRAVRQAIKSGKPWRAVIDSLRARTNELWLALPIAEQKRFRRHLQRHWDIVRHRMAPAIATLLDTELAAGTLTLQRGALHAVLPNKAGAVVQYRRSDGSVSELSAARVINCTGPDMNYHRVGSPLLNHLFAQGLIVSGPLGGGLWSDQRGAVRAQDGTYSSILFNLGPGKLGTLLESIAVPELREQAVELAAHLHTRISAVDIEETVALSEENILSLPSQLPLQSIKGVA